MKYNFEDLTLRSSLDVDVPFILRLETDLENSEFITPWAAEKHLGSFTDSDIFHAIISRDSQPVGFVILAGLKNKNSSVEFMRVVISDKNKGLGRQTVRAIKALCFEQFEIHRLWLDVKTFNTRAKHLYESEGFVVEGVLRDCLKAGEKYDSLAILSILSHEYNASKSSRS